MLKNLFGNFRKASKPTTQSDILSVPTDIGYHTPKTASELLGTPLRQQYIAMIWQNVSMTPDMFQTLYRKPIEKYAEMVQLLPASESHHHSHIGGMLDHGLEVIAIAARLRQSYILPQNAIPEEQAKQRDVWTAVVIYAALLHDIGKCAVDIEMVLKDGSRWFPWQGTPPQPYNFRYIKGRDYHLHPALGGFFANLLIPTSAFDWIAPFPKAFSDLMYFIAGHTDKAGILSEIIQKADQMSVTMALGGDINKLEEKPKTSFAKQLLIALRQVIEGYKFNSQQGGCDGWLTEDGLWVMSKSTADNIRAVLMKQGIAVPSQNGKLFDELQTHKLIEITAEGKAIWSCKVTSNEGWTHDKPFSLLRISPQIIWDHIDSRPPVFAGRVETTSAVTHSLTTDITMEIPDGVIIEPVNDPVVEEPIHKVEQTEAEILVDSGSDSVEFVLNLFSDVNGDQHDQHTEPAEKTQKSEPEKIILQSSPVSDIPAMVVETALPVENATHKSKSKKAEEKINIPATEQSDTENSDIDPHKFIEWIKAGVISGQLFVNRKNAVLHIVENHLFLVTPSIFKIYLRDVVNRTDTESWELLQKRFQTLGIHRRQHTEDDSRNIWKCVVAGPNKQSELNGFLIQDPKLLLGDRLFLNNQWLTLQGELK
ncbi:MobH family relaxase [Pasteurella multocida]